MLEWFRSNSKKKVFAGKHIREVWDFRLSKGCPILYNSGPTWVVKIWDNNAPGNEAVCLDSYDTQYPTSKALPQDPEGIKACYRYLYNVRDKYSRDNIELRKPVVKMINEANLEMNRLIGEANSLYDKGSRRESAQAVANAKVFLNEANRKIKAASEALNDNL